MSNFPMEMSNYTCKHQQYTRPEIYVVVLVYVSYLAVICNGFLELSNLYWSFKESENITWDF